MWKDTIKAMRMWNNMGMICGKIEMFPKSRNFENRVPTKLVFAALESVVEILITE